MCFELNLRGIKCNQNIIPECVDTGLPPLNVTIQDYIGKTSFDKYSWFNLGEFEWDKNNSVEKESLRVSAYLKNLLHEQQAQIFSELLREYGDEIRQLATPMMDIHDLANITESCEIGCHSSFIQTWEMRKFFSVRLEKCKSWFRSSWPRASLYVFPNGAHGKANFTAQNEGRYTY